MKDLPDVIKSPFDRREYASYELDNGLKVLIIRDPEIQCEGEGLFAQGRESCQKDSDSQDNSSEEECTSDVCVLI